MNSACRRVWVGAGLAFAVLALCGCAVGLIADIVSVGASGKSVAEHGLDVITGKDCHLVQSVFRADHAVCVPLETEGTTRASAPLPTVGPSVVDHDGGLGSGSNGDPGGPSGSESY